MKQRLDSMERTTPAQLTAAVVIACLGGLSTNVRAEAPAGAATEAVATPAASTPAAQPLPEPGSFDKKKEEITKLPKAADLKPTGPVTVTAKRAELVQNASAIYIGNVVLDSDTIKLDGDRLELKQHPGSQYEARVTGNPGHLSHAGKGPDDPSVAAHAKTMNYDSSTGIVDLIGDAYFKRGDDEISSDTIHYNLAEGRIQASGGDGGQVKIVLPPAPSSAPANTPPK